jgi:hypothetical protein
MCTAAVKYIADIQMEYEYRAKTEVVCYNADL